MGIVIEIAVPIYIDDVRFWAKVQRGAPDDCWLWTAAKVPSGYGSFTALLSPILTQSQHGAHRVSFAIANGRWPQRMVLHKCGNPPCVNPAHLYEGDGRQNHADKERHGRVPRGDAHPNTKLSEASVAEVRRRSTTGEKQVELARAFGVSQGQISNIVRGRQRGGSVKPPASRVPGVQYEKTCEWCGSEFRARRRAVDPPPRFCSKDCSFASHRQDLIDLSADERSERMKAYHAANPGKQRRGAPRACPVCGVEFYRPPSAKGETCSYACMGKLRSMRSKSTT